MIARKALLGASLLVGVACQPNSSPQVDAGLTPSQRSAIADSVQQAMKSFTAAAERVNPPEIFAFFSHSPDFATADNGTLYTSLDSLTRVYTRSFSSLRSQTIVVNQSKIVVLSPTAAVLTGAGTFSPVDSAGKRTPPRGFNWTFLWVREPSGWKILHAHQSFVPLTA